MPRLAKDQFPSLVETIADILRNSRKHLRSLYVLYSARVGGLMFTGSDLHAGTG